MPEFPAAGVLKPGAVSDRETDYIVRKLEFIPWLLPLTGKHICRKGCIAPKNLGDGINGVAGGVIRDFSRRAVGIKKLHHGGVFLGDDDWGSRGIHPFVGPGASFKQHSSDFDVATGGSRVESSASLIHKLAGVRIGSAIKEGSHDLNVVSGCSGAERTEADRIDRVSTGGILPETSAHTIDASGCRRDNARVPGAVAQQEFKDLGLVL